MLIELFFVFLKIGAITFGGGYAMLALIQAEVVGRGWCSPVEFADLAAAAQMTPGPVAINTATYVGMKTAGMAGALMATLGFVLPSIVIATLISLFLHHAGKNRYVEGALAGIRSASVGLIFAAVVFFAENSILSRHLPDNISKMTADGFKGLTLMPGPLIIFFAVILGAGVFKLKPVPAILFSMILGIGFYFLFGSGESSFGFVL
jgi:chromate transporter